MRIAVSHPYPNSGTVWGNLQPTQAKIRLEWGTGTRRVVIAWILSRGLRAQNDGGVRLRLKMKNASRLHFGKIPGLKPLILRLYFTGLKPGASTLPRPPFDGSGESIGSIR